VVAGAGERDGVAFGAGPGGSADSVDVIVAAGGDVVVDDVADPGDIEPARGDVGGHEDRIFAVAEPIERLVALGLCPVAVYGLCFEPGFAECSCDGVGPVFGSEENEGGRDVFLFEKLLEEFQFALLVDGVEALADGVDGFCDGAHVDAPWLVEHIGAEPCDVVAERCGEHEGLPLFGELVNDPADVGQESHVEHPVGLIEDEHLEVVELEAPAHVVEEPAGRGDDDASSFFECARLRFEPGAAVYAHARDAQRFADLFDNGVHLLGEFARGRQDEGLVPAGRAGCKTGYERERECEGFAGAGLGDGNDVVAFADDWNRLVLYGRGEGDIQAGKQLDTPLINVELFEIHSVVNLSSVLLRLAVVGATQVIDRTRWAMSRCAEI